jgi:hypothetical protein
MKICFNKTRVTTRVTTSITTRISDLSTTFFNIYESYFGLTILFADYITIIFSHKNFNKLQHIFNTDLKRIFDKLVASLSKSNYLLIGCDSNKKLELHIDIRETNSLKILGVTFDKRLSFHYEKLSKTVSKKVGAIYRIRKFLPQNTLILIYKTLIQSNLIYSCQVWGHTYETHLKKFKSFRTWF